MKRSAYLLYGAGGFAMHASNFLIVTWLTKFYTPGPGRHLVAPALFGLIVLGGRVVDAIADPLVGYWSDHHEGAKGRRIPFIRWGAPLLGLTLILAFTPPLATESGWNALYLVLVLAAFFFCYTVTVTPYLALIPELTSNPRERIRLTTTQAVFVLVATVYVAALSGPLIQWLQYVPFMILSGVLVFLTAYASLKVARPHPYQRQTPPANAKEIMRWSLSTLKSKPFLHVLISTSFFWFGLNLLMAGVAVWVANVLGGSEADVAQVMGPLIVSNLIGFYLFSQLAQRKGKYLAFVVMFIGMVLVTPFWFVVGRQSGSLPYLQAMIVCFFLGLPLAGFQALPFALLADVIDDDEKKHGERREAIFFGMQAIVQKTTIGLSILLLQGMRLFFGEQLGLRLIGPVAAVACLFGLLAFWGYPLRDSPPAPPANDKTPTEPPPPD